MLQDVIFLSEALKFISTLDSEGKAPVFSVAFRTLNRNSKTGGRLIEYPQVKLALKEKGNDPNSLKALRYKAKPSSDIIRNPRHFENKTRNVIVLPSGQMRKIHINHIISINNKKVVY